MRLLHGLAALVGGLAVVAVIVAVATFYAWVMIVVLMQPA